MGLNSEIRSQQNLPQYTHLWLPILFFRYNIDCDAAEGLYGLAEGAFGVEANAPDADGQSGGSCPVVDPLSDAECAGAVSTCWSPGQPDTDCPDFGICCFDGCANTCEGEGKIFIMFT